MRLTLILFLLLSTFSQARASDVSLIQAGVPAGRIGEPCTETYWNASDTFLNLSDVPQEVVVQEVSNGGNSDLPLPILVEPGGLRSLSSSVPSADGSPLSVIRVSVPPEVIVESRLEIRVDEPCRTPVGLPRFIAKVELPIIKELIPAGEVQYVMGVDSGSRDARSNVAVYNGSTRTATATIQTFGACGQVVTGFDVLIPPRTIQQFTIAHPAREACGASLVGSWFRYATVQVTEASFAVVSTLVNGGMGVRPATYVGLDVIKAEPRQRE